MSGSLLLNYLVKPSGLSLGTTTAEFLLGAAILLGIYEISAIELKPALTIIHIKKMDARC